MEEKKLQTPQLQFLTCPNCQGSGKAESLDCPNCQGLGMYAWTGSVLLYWGKKINILQNAQDRLETIVKNLINLSLFIFGFTGLFMLGWVMLSLNEQNYFVWEFYKLQNWQLLIFWLSLATDSYLLYRFNRDLEKIKRIPKREFQLVPQVLKPITWDQIKQLPKDKKINIVPYFTYQGRQSVVKSWEIALRYQDAQVNPIHLLVALLEDGHIQTIFSRLGVDSKTLFIKIKNILSVEPILQEGEAVLFSNRVKEVIFQAYYLAYRLRTQKVETTDLMESLAHQDNKVKELLYDLEITSDKIRNVTAWIRINQQLVENYQRFAKKASLRPTNTMNRSMTAIATPLLNAFSKDLTLLAQKGYLSPCIDRGEEIEQIFNVMHGGSRRSVILVGEPGIGKQSIVEGIAQKMAEETVPKFLQDKRLVSLDVAKLVSGVEPAVAQERLLRALNEIVRSGNIVLHVSNIHNMTGISAGREGSVDLADGLSNALENNQLIVIATAEPDEYKKYIEGKSSLDEVLEKINITEPTGNQAIRILESKVGGIERKEKIFFSYAAIEEVVNLSDRYLHDRYLPEKAIEILQEVATYVASKNEKNALVAKEDVASVISNKTKIPLTKITQDESEKLLNLEQKIHERMIGQAEAVDMVAHSLRRARAAMRDENRPIVNLLFLGPTGVGKTELAKTVAEIYFGGQDNMIRLDMSEYQEKSSINRLIGAPPGYEGSGAGGYLSEAVRKNPFSLILLDELEKAHPEIINIFLQVMDDGRLTDTTGRTIDFTNTIIIATSNAGSQYIQDEVQKGTGIETIKNELIKNQLSQYFRPEFLNRFNGIVVFKPLELEEVKQIAKLMVNQVAQQLEVKGIFIKATEAGIEFLAKQGFDPKFGARPLRRVIQSYIQDQLARLILENKIGRRDTAVIDSGGKITIEKAEKI